MTESNPLIFYDISSSVQPRTYAPNPSKSRLALNFKRVNYKTSYVDIPDIPDVRKGLKCSATRKLDDNSDFYTLPMLGETTSGKVIGDSFDIANYLEDTFPDSGGNLFPNDSAGTALNYESPNKDTIWYAPLTTNEGSKNEAFAKFNQNVDATFTANMVLFGQFLPFRSETEEEVKALFVKRAHLKSWDDICIEGEAREQLIAGFKVGLTSLAQLFVDPESGPYLEGKRASYADLIVGGWLNMLSVIMPKEEWKEFRTWHGGVFARLHDELQEKYFECK